MSLEARAWSKEVLQHPAGDRREVSALSTLVSGIVDYAGLYPPASLPMTEAASSYDAYRRGPDAFMLGRFVVGAARLEELAEAARPLWHEQEQGSPGGSPPS